MRNARGFTLIELMIAGTAAIVVVLGAFVSLTALQRSGARQAEAEDVVSSARLALEIMARDVRSAGDALELLPGRCLFSTNEHPDASDTFNCPAVLEAHPWRVILARNAWSASDGTRSRSELTDVAPSTTRAFNQEPENVVMYRFVQTKHLPTLEDADGTTRDAYIGRIERVVNPFKFPGTAGTEQVTVLLDNVLLDDRMRTNPADATQVDGRYDHALFMYQVLTQSDEFAGALSARTTSTGGPFLTPTLRFFKIADPGAVKTSRPYAQDHDAEIVGLEEDTTAYTSLLKGGSKGMKASAPDSDMRLVFDQGRIRTVRIAFKVLGPERVDIKDGVDLDDDPTNGTARVYAFETTAEIKPLALYTAL